MRPEFDVYDSFKDSKQIVRQIVEVTAQQSGADCALAALWIEFSSLEAALKVSSGERIEEIIDCQTQVIDAACGLTATSSDGLAYKLAIWREDSGLDKDDSTRGERLALTAMNDAIHLSSAGGATGRLICWGICCPQGLAFRLVNSE